MGINGLWDILGDGELTSLAELSTRHFEQHRRPFRVAIDEAGWRFKNLTPAQVAFIRTKEPRANPVEKAILFRVLKLRKLNIQAIFVFDGPKRPHKRGGIAGRIDWAKTKLTYEVLDNLGVPHHRAPGEPEAECARLQILGVVDAVWSEDGDSFMFGCRLLLRDYRSDKKGDGKKSETHVRLYRAEDLKAKNGIDREGLVLFALTNGCDYTKGVHGCGSKTALKLIQEDDGRVGQALWDQAEGRVQAWKTEFSEVLTRHLGFLPADFPHIRALKYCKTPTLSKDEELHNLRGLQHGWDMKIDQTKLRSFLQAYFNFNTKQYLKHLTPHFLVRQLLVHSLQTQVTGPSNLQNIQVVHQRARKSEEDDSRYETKIKFDPQAVVTFDLLEQPPWEDWAKCVTKAEPKFNPIAMMETEVLGCILRASLPPEALVKPTPAKKSPKRKIVSESDPAADPKPKKKRAPRKKKEALPEIDANTGQVPQETAAAWSDAKTVAHSSVATTIITVWDSDEHDDSEDELPDISHLARKPPTSVEYTSTMRPANKIKEFEPAGSVPRPKSTATVSTVEIIDLT